MRWMHKKEKKETRQWKKGIQGFKTRGTERGTTNQRSLTSHQKIQKKETRQKEGKELKNKNLKRRRQWLPLPH